MLFLRISVVAFFLTVSFLATASLADTVTLSTYYPAPAGAYDEMRANKMCAGTTCPGVMSAGLTANTSFVVPDGNVGIGVTDPGFILDVFGNARIQAGSGPRAGISYTNAASTIDRAFIGMRDDDTVGFWGNGGATWGLVMNVNTANVGIGLSNPSFKLHVTGGQVMAEGGVYVTGNPGIAWRGVATDPSTQMNAIKMDTVGGTPTYDMQFFTQGMEKMRFTTTGNLGIGSTAPSRKLDVAGGIQVGPIDGSTYAGSNTSLGLRLTSTGANGAFPNLVHPTGRIYGTNTNSAIGWGAQALVLGASDSWTTFKDTIMLLGDGRILMGTNTPLASLGAGVLNVGGEAYKSGGNVWQILSDEKIKDHIETLDGENAKEIVNKLRPVKFRYREEYFKSAPELKDVEYYGFIAQDYQKIFPNSVKENDKGLLTLDASNVTPYLVSAVQETSKEVKALQEEVAMLKNEILELKKQH